MVDVKPSTVVELLGFGALVYAAFIVAALAGWVVLGSFLLLVGYATDDDAVGFAVRKAKLAVQARGERRRLKRAG